MIEQFFGWLRWCWLRWFPKRYPPISDGKQQAAIEKGVQASIKSRVKDFTATARTVTTLEKRMRMHVAIEDKIGRGLMRSEWVGVAKKGMRRQFLREGWFFKREGRYFINRRKIERTFGPPPEPQPVEEQRASA